MSWAAVRIVGREWDCRGGLNNIPPPLLDIGTGKRMVIELPTGLEQCDFMKRLISISALLLFLGTSAQAACYADYKAKKDGPLRLHYGVIELPDAACQNRRTAADPIARRIAKGGWVLLNVVSVFGPEGLDQRRGSAGEFYLRF